MNGLSRAKLLLGIGAEMSHIPKEAISSPK